MLHQDETATIPHSKTLNTITWPLDDKSLGKSVRSLIVYAYSLLKYIFVLHKEKTLIGKLPCSLIYLGLYDDKFNWLF